MTQDVVKYYAKVLDRKNTICLYKFEKGTKRDWRIHNTNGILLLKGVIYLKRVFILYNYNRL